MGPRCLHRHVAPTSLAGTGQGGCMQGPSSSSLPRLPSAMAALGWARAKSLPAACILAWQHQLSRSSSRETHLLWVPQGWAKTSCLEQMAPDGRSNRASPGTVAEAAGAGLPGEGQAARRVLTWEGMLEGRTAAPFFTRGLKWCPRQEASLGSQETCPPAGRWHWGQGCPGCAACGRPQRQLQHDPHEHVIHLPLPSDCVD